MTPMFRFLFVLAALLSAFAAHADIPVKTYAQELVDRTVASDRELLVVVMHVTPPKTDTNVIIASNIGRIGKPGDADDLRVIETGKPNLEVGHGGKRFEVELPLQDVSGATIGALGLVWRYAPGQGKSAFERRAHRIRDALAKRILNAANLMDPYPFVASATTKTRAQKLVEETVAKHPGVTVLAMRGPVHGFDGIAVLGSTFGRHGKRADADDLKIFQSTEPVTGIYSNGKRFGVDLQLRDAGDRVIGTMNVGYAYREGDDPKALLAKALALRAELQKRIPSADSLQELDP
jgi:hypothetical protein